MARKDRIELIRKIEKKRKSKVIVYVTSDRQGLIGQIGADAIPVIRRHLNAVFKKNTSKIDLFLYSRGGDANTPWGIVSLIREYLTNRPFGVLLPFRAHSAATVIALGADEIVMTREAELGPIDPTIQRGPHNPREPGTNNQLPISVEDAMGYFDLLENVGLSDPSHKMEAFNTLSKTVNPLALGAVKRLLSQTQLVAGELLQTRNEPLTEERNKQIVKVLSTDIDSHEHVIHRSEALRSGLEFVKFADSEDLEDEIWDLYNQYLEFFEMDKPFQPNDEMIIGGDEEKTWNNLKLACIESTSRNDIYSIDLLVKQKKSVPPSVNFNINNLQLAIPPIPAGLDAAQIQEFINNVVRQVVQAQVAVATDQAIQDLVKSLPSQGFEHVQLSAAWRRDTSGV